MLICKLLCRFYEVLHEEGQFLSDNAAKELRKLGLRLAKEYTKLANQCANAQLRKWKATPKLHLFLHLVEWQCLTFGNPRFCWAYSDEDLVGQLIDVAETCHARTLSSTAMFKWLTLVFSESA